MCVIVIDTAMSGTVASDSWEENGTASLILQGETQSKGKAFPGAPSVNVESGCVKNVPLNFLLLDVHNLKTVLLQSGPVEIN